MFGFNKKKDSDFCIVSSGSKLIGKAFFEGVTRVAGTLEGNIIAEGLLLIEETGIVKGEIITEELICCGKIEGKIHAKKKAEFENNSYFTGDISCPTLIIQEGASFNGNSLVVDREEKKILEQVNS